MGALIFESEDGSTASRNDGVIYICMYRLPSAIFSHVPNTALTLHDNQRLYSFIANTRAFATGIS